MLRKVSLPPGITGRLLLSRMPGRHSPFSGEEALITNAVVDTVVCLAPLDEIRVKSPEYAKRIEAQHLQWSLRSFPIPDYGLPAKEDQRDFPALVRDVVDALKDGRTVLIHCGAGIGRTGMVATCVLVALGQGLDEALSTVRHAGSHPENEDQVSFVRRFQGLLNGLTGVSPAGLSWLTGNWLGHNGEDSVEEHWSPLGGNTLMGMFRWVTDGKVRFYELIAVEQEGELVFLRIKHFDPGLVGWEEKASAHEFVLVQLKDREAVFLELDKPSPRWAVYRLESQNRLVSYFARENEAVTETGMFEYTRQ